MSRQKSMDFLRNSTSTKFYSFLFSHFYGLSHSQIHVDTFASRIAARVEKNADASIGNSMAPSILNVFLGIGMPWLISAIYHNARGNTFYVASGQLKSAVLLFGFLALIGFSLLMVRRFVYVHGQRGELGGWVVWRWTTAILFCILWAIYITISALESFCVISIEKVIPI